MTILKDPVATYSRLIPTNCLHYCRSWIRRQGRLWHSSQDSHRTSKGMFVSNHPCHIRNLLHCSWCQGAEFQKNSPHPDGPSSRAGPWNMQGSTGTCLTLIVHPHGTIWAILLIIHMVFPLGTTHFGLLTCHLVTRTGARRVKVDEVAKQTTHQHPNLLQQCLFLPGL